MKTWRWMTTLVAAGALVAACSVETKKSSDDDSSTGGTGGSATTAGTGGTTAPATTAPATTVGAGGMSGCALTNLMAPADNPCLTCGADLCCTELQGCDGSMECLDWLGCTNNCTDEACEMACDTANPAGAALWDTFETCLDAQCAAECPTQICDSGLVIGAPACAECLGDNCCQAIKDCEADANCLACITVDMTQPGACDAGMLDEPVRDCWNGSCTANMECGMAGF